MKKKKGEEKADSTETKPTGRFLKYEAARRIVQFCSFLLFNAGIFGLAATPVLLPVLQSLGVPQKTVGGAFGALQLMLYEVVFPWLPLAAFFLTAILVGRALCGWACPFGFVQDLLGYVKRKHVEFSPRTHEGMVNVKYLILVIVLFISGMIAVSSVMGTGREYGRALGEFAEAPFNVLSPSDTLFAALPRFIFDARYSPIVLPPLLFWVRLAIMVGVLVLAVYVERSWCRYLCPVGAFMALLNRFSFLGLKRNPTKCTKAGCRECVDVCPTKVPILDLPWEKFTDPECIYCLKCVEACSTRAIRPKFP